MRSRAILALHTTMFFAFVIGSLSSPFIALSYPTISPWPFILATLFLATFVVGSWGAYGGCPFTIWENKFREQEQRGSSYPGPCIDHYAYVWFGLKIPGRTSTMILLVLLLLPGAVGLLRIALG
jgi:hypothetical protein